MGATWQQRFKGIAGLGPSGSYFEPPVWVDQKKPPGTTSMFESSYGRPGWWRYYASGAFLFFGPNLHWLAITLLVWHIAPYDLDAVRVNTGAFLLRRLCLHMFVVVAYHGFWHLSLFQLSWSSRPLKHGRRFRSTKFAHNCCYSAAGVLMWSCQETAFAYCFATGRLPYLRGGSGNMLVEYALFALACLLMPLWRDLHFYFTHRLIHLRPIYRCVHAVHHRNADVDPFAGLCMHPVEHLFYFGSPAMFLCASPFAVLWNGYHCLLAPIGGHTGFEVHFNQSQFHYLHHRFFECNYGGFGIPFDKWLGTFREKLPESKGAQGGGYADAADAKAAIGWPEGSDLIYGAIVAACWAPLALAATGHVQGQPPSLVAAAAVLGPLLAPFPLVLAGPGGAARLRSLGARRLLLAPFDRESGRMLALHLTAAALLSVLPQYQLLYAFVAPPGHGVACRLWGRCG